MDLSKNGIIYEVEEYRDGRTFSQFYTKKLVLSSREQALNHFLRSTFENERVLTKLFVRHLRTGEKVELLNTYTYDEPFECLRALEREAHFFSTESIACHLLIFDKTDIDKVRIFWPRNMFYSGWKTPTTSIVCCHMYWVFFHGRKKEQLLPY